MKSKSRYVAFFCIIFITGFIISLAINRAQDEENQTISKMVDLIIQREAGFNDSYLISRRLEELERFGITLCSKLERISDPALNIIDRTNNTSCLESSSATYIQNTFENQIGQRWQFSYKPNTEKKYLTIRLIALFLIGTIFSGLLAFVIFNIKSTAALIETKARIYNQIIHDIRSPVLALKTLIEKGSHQHHEEKRLAKASLVRIEAMLSDLSDKKDDKHFFPLAALIVNVVQEKIVEHPRISFEVSTSESMTPFIRINSHGFHRAISNILNNSIEANAKKVRIHSSRTNNGTLITITDDGSGIPPQIVKKIGKNRISTKGVDRGFGLSGAFQFFKNNDSKLSIVNTCSNGTTLTIQTRQDNTLSRFISSILVSENRKLSYITNHSADLINLFEANTSSPNLPSQTGINFFKEWNEYVPDVSTLNILVADHVSQSDIDQIYKKNCYVTSSCFLKPDFFKIVKRILLIDDDKYIRANWTKRAADMAIPIYTFATLDLTSLEKIQPEPDDHIFIDKELNGVSGLDLRSYFYNRGWHSIWIQTGHDPRSISVPFEILGVLGKDFPVC